MASLLRLTHNIINNVSTFRLISTNLPNRIKEVVERPVNDALVIEGVIKSSPRSDKLIKEASKEKFCPECTLGLDIKHTDVLILSQYVRSDGCMLPKRITGLCHRQQKKIGKLVTMAQKAGLMPNLAPYWSKRDPKKRFGWRKYNKYFDETTIRY